MEFNVFDLKHRGKGEIVEVTLKGNAANVRLLDHSNYLKYKRGQRHSYRGGLVKRSPWQVAIPRTGHWYITVDLNGLKGRTKAAVRVMPGALPAAKNQPLSSVPSLLHDVDGNYDSGELYDVFISHASEDKDEVVRPLATALKNLGLRVWYDEFELKIGDSLRRKIDQGLSRSRFGVVVISRDFIKKGWTNYELDGLITRAVSGEQSLLPIWHNITRREVMDFSPSLADKVARNTAVDTIEDIAVEIGEVIKGPSGE